MFVACDESGVRERFFVLGSVWVPKNDVSDFEKRVSDLRLHYKCWGEVKWGKIRNQEPENITRFYEKFVQAASDMEVFFRFIVIDTEKLEEREVTEELQLKFMYLLISRNAVRGDLQKRVNPADLHILFDQFQESRQSREEGWRRETKRYIEGYLNCEIEHFQPCHSHINSFVQLIDIVTGMICERKNGGENTPLTENKAQLEKLVIGRYGNRFDVWDWHPYPIKYT